MRSWARSCIIVAVAAPLAAPVVAPLAAQGTPVTGRVVAVTEQPQTIRLRDGTPLEARLLTSGTSGRQDTFVELRAGRAAEPESLAVALARKGWPVLIVTPREGDLTRLGRDGLDVIEWVPQQRWATGRVLMFGAGDAATAAWATAEQRPPHLLTIAPRTPSRGAWGAPSDSSRVALPVLSWGPSFAESQGALMDTYQHHVERAPRGAAEMHYLAVGTVGPLDQVLLLDGWGKWATGRENKPPLLQRRVNYMMDDGTWYSVDSIGALGTLSTGYPLHSPTEIAAAGATGAPGFLGGAAQDKESADSIGASGEQRYETMPYEAAVDLLGRPSAVVWMRRAAGGAPEAVLEEVTKDGRTVALGFVRGRMRTMLSGPGGPARWEFAGFPFVARRMAVGSRIRLTLRGVRGAVVLHELESYSRVDLPLVGTGRKSRAPGG